MHDIRAIRENPQAFDAALERRGAAPASAAILSLDETRRARIKAAEDAQAEQNKASKLVGAAKAKGDEAEFERLRALVAETKAEVAAMQAEANELDRQLRDARWPFRTSFLTVCRQVPTRTTMSRSSVGAPRAASTSPRSSITTSLG